MPHSEFVGVDGCPCGWFSVGFSRDGSYELNAFLSFDQLVAHYRAATLILVDMPIGLPDGPEERRCDPEARALLRPNGSRVFRAPTRAALIHLVHHPGDKQGTRAEQIRITGKSLSEQSIAIMPKIAEVDGLLPREDPPQIREVHPEVCFWALNNGNHVVASKHTASGIEERIRILGAVCQTTDEILAEGRARYVRNRVASDDDILDALAAAVTAYRGYPNQLQTLPRNSPTQIDGRGLPMEMVFWRP